MSYNEDANAYGLSRLCFSWADSGGIQLHLKAASLPANNRAAPVTLMVLLWLSYLLLVGINVAAQLRQEKVFALQERVRTVGGCTWSFAALFGHRALGRHAKVPVTHPDPEGCESEGLA